MLLDARRLVDRLRYPRARVDDVARVRRRLLAQPDATAEEREAGQELLRRKEALFAALAPLETRCSRCATAYPAPHGRWAGGYCCGGPTEGVFTDDELAALRTAGTTPGSLRPPPGEQAGCAFRGPEGCSLATRDRPSVCVLYVCRGLEAELRAQNRWSSVSALRTELQRAMVRFRRARDSR